MEFLNSLLTYISDMNVESLSAWSSFLSFIVTAIALVVAIYSLRSWKNQKHYELNIELKSHMGEALSILNRLNKTVFLKLDLTENQNWVINDLKKRFSDDDLINVQLLQSGFYNHFFKIEPEILKLRQISMKAVSLSKDKKLREYYSLWMMVEGHIFNTIFNYTSIKLNGFSIKYNFPQIHSSGQLLPLPSLKDLVNKGQSENDAIEKIFKELNTISSSFYYRKLIQIYSDIYLVPTIKIVENIT